MVQEKRLIELPENPSAYDLSQVPAKTLSHLMQRKYTQIVMGLLAENDAYRVLASTLQDRANGTLSIKPRPAFITDDALDNCGSMVDVLGLLKENGKTLNAETVLSFTKLILDAVAAPHQDSKNIGQEAVAITEFVIAVSDAVKAAKLEANIIAQQTKKMIGQFTRSHLQEENAFRGFSPN